MSIYLDASVIVPLFTQDVFTDQAERIFETSTSTLIVSDIGKLEFASVLARDYRTGNLSMEAAQIAFATFDVWMTAFANETDVSSADIATAQHWLRRLDLTLRTVDAIHIAIAQRLGAELATFDQKMAAAATALNVRLARV